MKVDATYITVVSGLPRTGTSLCMRMLEAGGLPVLADGIREADEDNPNGYYEFEAVKRTRQDPSWLEQAGGKAVKMVYMLLHDLPPGYEYRVIFMQRNLQEVVRSQEVMLQRSSEESAAEDASDWEDLFRKELDKLRHWIQGQENFTLLGVNYNELMKDPLPTLSSINAFLDRRLDVSAMVEVIDPSLYRNRSDKQIAPLAV